MKKIYLLILALFFMCLCRAQIEVYPINQQNPSSLISGQIDIYDLPVINFSGVDINFQLMLRNSNVTYDFNAGPNADNWIVMSTSNSNVGMKETDGLTEEGFFECMIFNDCQGNSLTPHGYGAEVISNSPVTVSSNSTFIGNSATLFQSVHIEGLAFPQESVCCSFPSSSSGPTFLGFALNLGNNNYHYGWISYSINAEIGISPFSSTEYLYHNGIDIHSIAIESSVNVPIEMGSTISQAPPGGLNEEYSNNNILLQWSPFPNSVACQIKGGLEGGTDPHTFIITGTEPSQKFINGNGLIIGEEYQWKVRCATGVNPYSGITPWSDYDYFTYNPLWDPDDDESVLEEELELKIYPNPSQDESIISISNFENQTFILELKDQRGRTVRTEMMNDAAHILERQNLASGMYLLNLKTPNGQILKSEKILFE